MLLKDRADINSSAWKLSLQSSHIYSDERFDRKVNTVVSDANACNGDEWAHAAGKQNSPVQSVYEHIVASSWKGVCSSE